MTKNGEDSSYDNMANMFIGVRFVLMGFNPVLEAEIRSKLVNGGGVDVGEYALSCTHVIVDNIIYDDPICVAARSDGKTLVTGLWVEHSFYIGMPADASSILYRPVKDLNGIPGAKSLYLCLTGYQRQDREDIMKMVGMMGAQFSKPLVANKVTHLICYKFEGEKYELAKKTKKIKLVNHRWLEDCLRGWEILPEDDYDKSSGYELEMMEAEAMDSDEETKDYSNKQCEGTNATGSPFGLINGTLRGSKSPMPTREVLEICQKNVLPKGLSKTAENIIANNKLLITPGKATISDKSPYFHDVNKSGLEDFGCHGNGASYGDAVGGGTSIPFDNTSNLAKECNESTYSSRIAVSPHSDAAKLTTISYSRKTRRRSSVSVAAEPSGHTHGFLRGLEGKKANEKPGTSSLTVEQAKDYIDSDCGDLYHQGGQTGILPQKRKLAVSSNGIRSPNEGIHDSKAFASVSPSGGTLEGLEFESMMIGAPSMRTGPPSMRTGPTLNDNKHHSNAIACVNSIEDQQNGPSMLNSSSSNQKLLKCGLLDLNTLTFYSTESSNLRAAGLPQENTSETSMGALKSFNPASEPDIGDVEVSRTAALPADKKIEPQRQHQDVKVSSPNIKTSASEKSKSPMSLGMRKGMNDRLVTKKMVGQKSLGSRLGLSTAESNKLKCSFGFDNTATPNGAAVCPIMGVVEAEDEQTVVEKHDICWPTSAADVIIGKEKKREKTTSVDDETEVPVDVDGDEVEKQITEKGLEFESMMIGAPPMRTGPTLYDNKHHSNAIACLNSIEDQRNDSSMLNSSSSNQKLFKCGLPDLNTSIFYSTESSNMRAAALPQENTSKTSMGDFKSFNSASEPDIGDVEVSRTADLPADKKIEPQRQHQDVKVSSPNIKNSGSEKSESPISLGMCKVVNDGSVTKKMVDQKSLGSGLGLSTAESNKLKCSFSFDKTATPNGAAVCPIMGIVGAEDEQAVVEKHNICWPTSAADVIIGKENKKEKTTSVNDETEVPEDEDGDELEKQFSEKSEMVKATSCADELVDKQPKQVQQLKNRRKDDTLTMDADRVAAQDGKGVDEQESAVREKKTGMCESTFIADADGENTTNGGKHPSRKTRKAVSTVAGIKTSRKGKKENELRESEIGAELDKAFDNKTGMHESTFKEEMANEEKHSPKKISRKTLSSRNEVQTCDKAKDTEEICEGQEGSKPKKSFSAKMTERGKSNLQANMVKKDITQGERHPKTNRKAISIVNEIETPDEGKSREEVEKNISIQKTEVPKVKRKACPTGKTLAEIKRKKSMDAEKENKPIGNEVSSVTLSKHGKTSEAPIRSNQMIGETDLNKFQAGGNCNIVKTEPVWFILSGHHLQRKEFQHVIRNLKGRLCRDSHHWSYQATHFIVPDPVRRTEKFFAATASGRWILRTDYLTASNQAGKFLQEEPYEWYRSGLSEDGTINLEAPRKWRLLKERTGHGAFYGIRVIIYGECIAPPLDTLKRVLKAGDGTILATSPPYTRFLKSGVDFAIVSPGIPRADSWVQEFLRHEIPCVLADYIVEYVCKPGYSLDKHVLYNTHAWSEKSFANMLSRSEEIIEASIPSDSTDILNCPKSTGIS